MSKNFEMYNETTLTQNIAEVLDTGARGANMGAKKSVAAYFPFPTSATAVDGIDPVTKAAIALPKCIITDAYYYVDTTFTAAADAAVIKLGTSEDDDEFVAAVAISDASNTWDAGLHGTIPSGIILGSDATTFTKGTAVLYNAQRFGIMPAIATAGATLTIESDIACTAGSLTLFVEYYEIP